MIYNRIIDFFLLACAAAVWLMMLGLRFAEYDTNILCFGIAALISGFVSGLIILAWFKKRQIVKDSMLSAILFLITSSPLALFVFLELFTIFIGRYELRH